MLMIFLYGLAAFAETGVSIWIFGKMFPKRERGDAYRLGERILLTLVTFLIYTSLEGYLEIKINKGLFFGVYFTVLILDTFLSRILDGYDAKYMQIRKWILFVYMCILLTIQYWTAYLSGFAIITGNMFIPLFLVIFFKCKLFQSYFWEVLYLVNLGLLKILYIFAVGLLNHKNIWDYAYSGYYAANSYAGVCWLVCIIIVVVILQKTLNIHFWMSKLLKEHIYMVGIICTIEYGVLFFLIHLSNMEIKIADLIIGFIIVTGVMFALLLISVRYYMKNITAEKNILEVKNKAITNQYQELDENYRKYRCFVHDEKYLFNYITQCMQDGKIEEIQSVIEKRKDQFTEKIYWTGIGIIDNVIALEKRKIERQNIEFQLDTDVTDIFMDEMDFIILFENVFNNAIEAVTKCTGDRKIKVFIKNINDTLLFKVWNSSSKLPTVKGKKFVTDKVDSSGHGWGIESVKYIVEKYEGEVIFRYDDSFFEVVITIGKQ